MSLSLTIKYRRPKSRLDLPHCRALSAGGDSTGHAHNIRIVRTPATWTSTKEMIQHRFAHFVAAHFVLHCHIVAFLQSQLRDSPILDTQGRKTIRSQNRNILPDLIGFI
jgi:hypothetical protein